MKKLFLLLFLILGLLIVPREKAYAWTSTGCGNGTSSTTPYCTIALYFCNSDPTDWRVTAEYKNSATGTWQTISTANGWTTYSGTANSTSGSTSYCPGGKGAYWVKAGVKPTIGDQVRWHTACVDPTQAIDPNQVNVVNLTRVGEFYRDYYTFVGATSDVSSSSTGVDCHTLGYLGTPNRVYAGCYNLSYTSTNYGSWRNPYTGSTYSGYVPATGQCPYSQSNDSYCTIGGSTQYGYVNSYNNPTNYRCEASECTGSGNCNRQTKYCAGTSYCYRPTTANSSTCTSVCTPPTPTTSPYTPTPTPSPTPVPSCTVNWGNFPANIDVGQSYTFPVTFNSNFGVRSPSIYLSPGGSTIYRDTSISQPAAASYTTNITIPNTLAAGSYSLSSFLDNAAAAGVACTPTKSFIVAAPAWYQSVGGDVRNDDGISVLLPTGQYFSANQAASPTLTGGVVYTSQSSASFGSGTANPSNWLAKNLSFAPSTPGIKTSYAYVNANIAKSKTCTYGTHSTTGDSNCTAVLSSPACAGTAPSCTLTSTLVSGTYKRTGDLNILSTSYTFPANGNFVFLIDGDLNINPDLIVPNTSTVVFVVSGDITVGTSVTNIEGIFSADGQFNIGSNSPSADTALTVEGNIVANAGLSNPTPFTNLRDLGASNSTTPNLKIIYRPDFILHLPNFLKRVTYSVSEVAPQAGTITVPSATPTPLPTNTPTPTPLPTNTPTPTPLPPGPVAQWLLDEGTGTVTQDATVNNNDGTLTGSPTWQTSTANCKYGKCILFDGVDDKINAGNGASLNITGAITVQAWVKLTALPAANTSYQIISKDKDTGGRSFVLDASSFTTCASGTTCFRFYVNGGGYTSNREIRATGSISTNTWYHVAGTYTPSGALHIYINGVLADSSTVSTAPASINSSTANVTIGAREYAGYQEYFKGYIDEPTIYNYVKIPVIPTPTPTFTPTPTPIPTYVTWDTPTTNCVNFRMRSATSTTSTIVLEIDEPITLITTGGPITGSSYTYSPTACSNNQSGSNTWLKITKVNGVPVTNYGYTYLYSQSIFYTPQ